MHRKEKKWLKKIFLSKGYEIFKIESKPSLEGMLLSEIITDQGNFYFKSGLGVEASNMDFVNLYSKIFTPSVFASDIKNNRLVTNYGGEELIKSECLDTWYSSVRELATLANVDTEKASVKLPKQKRVHAIDFCNFIANKEIMSFWGVDQELIENLASHRNNFSRILDNNDFDKSELQLTHGDSHPKNCLFEGSLVRWFDFSDLHLAPPMVDIAWFLTWLLPPRKDLKVNINLELLESLYMKYASSIDNQYSNLDIFDVMAYGMVHRIMYMHNKFRLLNDGKLYFVQYYLRLLLRVLERRIG